MDAMLIVIREYDGLIKRVMTGKRRASRPKDAMATRDQRPRGSVRIWAAIKDLGRRKGGKVWNSGSGSFELDSGKGS